MVTEDRNLEDAAASATVPPLRFGDLKPVLAGLALVAANIALYVFRGAAGFYLFYALSALIFVGMLVFTAKGHNLYMFLRVFVMVWATYSLVLILYLIAGVDMHSIMADAALLSGIPRLLVYFAAIPFVFQFCVLLILRKLRVIVLASPGLIFCTTGLVYVFVFGFVVLNMAVYT